MVSSAQYERWQQQRSPSTQSNYFELVAATHHAPRPTRAPGLVLLWEGVRPRPGAGQSQHYIFFRNHVSTTFYNTEFYNTENATTQNTKRHSVTGGTARAPNMRMARALAFGLWLTLSVESYPSYRFRVPHGDTVPCPTGVQGCIESQQFPGSQVI